MDRVVGGSAGGASIEEARITDLDFANDAVIFAETLDVLTHALETLSEEAEPLGLHFSWFKQRFRNSVVSWMLLGSPAVWQAKRSKSWRSSPTSAA